MALTEVPRPAYFTAAWDLAGALKIQQIQYRTVLDRDGVPDRELELLPSQFIKAPLENDPITATLAEALDAINAGALLRIADLEAQLDAATQRADRLQILVDAFPSENPGPGSAAEPGLEP